MSGLRIAQAVTISTFIGFRSSTLACLRAYRGLDHLYIVAKIFSSQLEISVVTLRAHHGRF